MNKQWTQNKSKTAKGCTVLCLALVIACALSVMNDWNHYLQQMGAVMNAAGPHDLQSISSAFISIAAAKCPMFLIPAAACGDTAIAMQGMKAFGTPKAAAKAAPAKA